MCVFEFIRWLLGLIYFIWRVVVLSFALLFFPFFFVFLFCFALLCTFFIDVFFLHVGVGKTSLLTALAQLSGHPLVRINLSEQTDMMDLLGMDLPLHGGKGGFVLLLCVFLSLTFCCWWWC